MVITRFNKKPDDIKVMTLHGVKVTKAHTCFSHTATPPPLAVRSLRTADQYLGIIVSAGDIFSAVSFALVTMAISTVCLRRACCSSPNLDWRPNALVRKIDGLDINIINLWVSCFLEGGVAVAEGESETGHLSPGLGRSCSCVDRLEIGCRTGAGYISKFHWRKYTGRE